MKETREEKTTRTLAQAEKIADRVNAGKLGQAGDFLFRYDAARKIITSYGPNGFYCSATGDDAKDAAFNALARMNGLNGRDLR